VTEPPTDTALAAKALLARIDNSTYRRIMETRAVLWGWQGARGAGLWDTHVSDAVAIRALDGIWDLLRNWAAEADEQPEDPKAEAGLPRQSPEEDR
jgi:hypothetical protein